MITPVLTLTLKIIIIRCKFCTKNNKVYTIHNWNRYLDLELLHLYNHRCDCLYNKIFNNSKGYRKCIRAPITYLGI